MYKLRCRMKFSLLDAWYTIGMGGETDGRAARRAGEHKWHDQIRRRL